MTKQIKETIIDTNPNSFNPEKIISEFSELSIRETEKKIFQLVKIVRSGETSLKDKVYFAQKAFDLLKEIKTSPYLEIYKNPGDFIETQKELNNIITVNQNLN
jgi:hypothetical protein